MVLLPMPVRKLANELELVCTEFSGDPNPPRRKDFLPPLCYERKVTDGF